MWSWIRSYFKDYYDEENTSQTVGIVAFCVIAVGFFSCVLAGYLSDKWARTKLCIVALSASGLASILIGSSYDAPQGVPISIAVIWGFAVIADSAQYSTMVSEVCDQSLVGTALTLQLSCGFLATIPSIFLVPVLEGAAGWTWAFWLCAPGPAVAILALIKLRASPKAHLIGAGRM